MTSASNDNTQDVISRLKNIGVLSEKEAFDQSVSNEAIVEKGLKRLISENICLILSRNLTRQLVNMR